MSKVNGDQPQPFQVFPDLPPEEFEILDPETFQRTTCP
jgi:hypothetical protein